jgi:hypothetical protein
MRDADVCDSHLERHPTLIANGRNGSTCQLLTSPRPRRSSSSDCRNQSITLVDPVMRLLIPNDLATIVTEIVLKSLAPFGYRTAHSTDPPLRSAKASPRLILFAFGIVGAHDVRKYSPAQSRFLRTYAVRPPRERIVDETRRFSQACAICSPC